MRVTIDRIVSIKKDQNDVQLCFREWTNSVEPHYGNIKIKKSIKELGQLLWLPEYVQVGKHCIVNLMYVDRIDDSRLLMKNGEQIGVENAYQHLFNGWCELYPTYEALWHKLSHPVLASICSGY